MSGAAATWWRAGETTCSVFGPSRNRPTSSGGAAAAARAASVRQRRAAPPTVVDQIPDSSRASVARSPLSEAGAGWSAPVWRTRPAEGVPPVAEVHPPRERRRSPAPLEGGRVEQGGEQRPRPLGPVVRRPRPAPAAAPRPPSRRR